MPAELKRYGIYRHVVLEGEGDTKGLFEFVHYGANMEAKKE